MRHPRNPRTSRPLALGPAVLAAAACTASLHADTLYWDTNGAAAGAGNPADGTWSGAAANWSTDAAGGSATAGYSSGSDVVFSAGADAASAAVNVSGTQSALSMLFQEGSVAFTGSQVAVGSGGITVNSTAGPVSFANLNLNAATAVTTLTLDATGAASGVGVSAASYVRSGVVLVRGTNLGAAAPGTANTANLTFTAAPALIGAGAADTTNVGALQRTFAETNAAGTSAFLATYDATTGVRPLRNTEYVGTVTAGQNVVLTGLFNMTSDVTVQTLMVGAGAQVTGGRRITPSTGDVLVAGGANLGLATSLGTGGSGGLNVTALNDLTVNSIEGGSNIHKYGPATLTLAGRADGFVNVHEGLLIINGGDKTKNTTINGGTLRLVGSNSLLDTSNVTVNAGGTPELDGVSERINGITGAGNVAGTAVTTATLTVGRTGQSGGSGTLTGVVSGNLGLVKDATGTLTLGGTLANTYTGTTSIVAGTLALQKTAGVSAIAGDLSVAGTLQLLADEQIADSATLTLGDGTINLGAFTETLDALLVNGTTMSVLGGGALVVTTFDVGGSPQSAGVYDNSDFAWIAADGTTITVIPEPASLVLAAVGALVMLPRRRA